MEKKVKDRDRITEADLKWLDSPEVFRVNQLSAHSDHAFFKNKDEWGRGESSFVQPLNGEWDFCYSRNASERPAEFYKEDYDRKDFDRIKVPGHIELAGYDKIQYINTMYPWEGHIFRRPPYMISGSTAEEGSFSEADYNPVGSYVCRFDLGKELYNKRVCICFEGVEQAMYLWLNGHFIGYAEDSFTPSEFDISSYIKEKNNLLAVEVHKRSTAAFLEDQDFFRFFGIFRNVTLYAKPALHVEDIWVKPVLLEDNETGIFSLEMKISSEETETIEGAEAELLLYNKNGKLCMEEKVAVKEKMLLSERKLEGIVPWDNKNPYLYTLTVTLSDREGRMIEFTAINVGFRRVEIRERIMLLNGKRLILCGVNRHEWNAESGRCITKQDMEFDIALLCENNINAVRTSHYPNQIPWYSLCDEYGIYVMAETNLESHGSWQKMGEIEPSWNVPGDDPHWKEAVLDRAKTNFETFKNHPSILFWSLGNESYAGADIAAMNKYFKEKDSSRLVHYEGVVHNCIYKDIISDMESRMYASPDQIREYLSEDPAKPFILCEYMHDMGNSLGGMGSYMALLEQYEMYQGGFIWDYIDQALAVVDEVTGEKVLRYGGDFDDRPSDYEFSGNGIIFADRTVKPALQEVCYYYGLYRK